MLKSKFDLIAEAAKKWILERYDQRCVDTSEINFGHNDQVCCTKVTNPSGVVKGILTIWEDNSKLQYHFDKR